VLVFSEQRHAQAQRTVDKPLLKQASEKGPRSRNSAA